MPLNPHASVGTNIKEFRTGKTYRHTEEKYGKDDADKQALAVALHTQDQAHKEGHHVADLTQAKRDRMPKSEFGQPEKEGFPMNDKKHDRLAIGGATRAFNAGNISKSEEEHLKSEARAKLGEHDPKGGDPPAHDHKAAVAKMHPEHVHKLVQDAHAGKFGPEAQRTAQAAMQSAAPQDTDQDGPTAAPPKAMNPFSAGDEDEDADQDAPVPAGSIFGGRGR